MQKYGFGVDIGGTTCKIGLFLQEGRLLEKWEIPTEKENKGQGILEQVAKALEGKMQELGLNREDMLGVGLDVPGPVGKDGMVHQCVNIGWENYPAADLLRKRLQMNVKICNDANAAALGEMWQGGGSGYADLVMVTLGTGVGGAVILDGKIIPGEHGIAGELGHIVINEKEQRTCACGKKGCLEQYASATGLVWIAEQLLQKAAQAGTLKNTGLLDKKRKLSAKSVFDAAKAGDEIALEAVEVLGKSLGKALGDVSCVINPQIYVIGGGVSRAGEMLLDVTEKYFRQEVLPAGRETKFALATLGNDAGMYGCFRMLLD